MKNKVRGYRTMGGYNQKQLADILEITPQSLSAKENGRRSFNDFEKVLLLDLFKEIEPELTIDKLFFDQEVSKS
ncbi:DNA-binding transcriptional regulator, XRE-family HTH domain [Alkalibacterium gilvum]|uniref:DNA-binding transcriptional regulator, XRE-family HTH domain n=1 Tax=Alkalibacterium gilvum TaxID=1130080 RepID=A0A1H6S5T6_9LACT|nr:helix-turn-helix domain-containing protein [Alkalibacterium gilvum]SEI59085.1 DNA-binding transcriptional regulator, XRE-family HTH domain [Alkalibacterium gilvum]